jgi:hypothetical protein
MFWLVGFIAVAVLSHLAPFPFLLDVTDETVWRMPATGRAAVYLTFDDGPNPSATPQLLDVLRKHEVAATFFVIDKYVTTETAPIVRRMFDARRRVARGLQDRGMGVDAVGLQLVPPEDSGDARSPARRERVAWRYHRDPRRSPQGSAG